MLAENPDETPLESLNVKENTVVHVVKKIGKDGRQAKFDQFQNEPPKPVPKSTVSELALALKTMILSPNFFNAIDVSDYVEDQETFQFKLLCRSEPTKFHAAVLVVRCRN